MSPTDGHTIIEVATVAIIDGVIVDGEKWSSLIRPGRPIPAEASAVHGITDAMVEEAPAPETVAVELRRRCCDETLVFHNYPFDLPFLSALLRAGGAAPFYNPVTPWGPSPRAWGCRGSPSTGPSAMRSPPHGCSWPSPRNGRRRARCAPSPSSRP